jgi:nuclear pore complex protein Nup188
LISAELKRNQKKLTSVLHFYKKQNTSSADNVRKDASLSSLQQDFILKLAGCLELDEIQCSDLYCTFLLRDYRGSKKDLQDVLSSDRHRRALTHRVRNYYISERLYLLRCLKHLLSFWEEDQHPYSTAFAEFVRQIYSSPDFIKEASDTTSYLLRAHVL